MRLARGRRLVVEALPAAGHAVREQCWAAVLFLITPSLNCRRGKRNTLRQRIARGPQAVNTV
ncbi:hypothetical protein MYBA111488_16395 [Mycobacterium basiliense]